ncbi:unnamed protein product [Kuraishia capsulata CBS 1993]|uniref:RRM domain-containing protein n=1 Tax=Kuraishia capsulata CBS 1993 TaxID=1382522 RepID=W6MRQ5_9ASCO|nr:uncharacterized protein KUCA_T00005392001 [Kuraishia capsulata CBS 1993]CDK29404.1 unnamed protein product [Kuraishia capsulata CBS 1993]
MGYLEGEFLQSQVGGVKSVNLSYNEKGISKGIATVSFHKPASASKAMEKFNGAPIDGGKSKLRLELVVDPTKKPLSSRITVNSIAPVVAKGKAKVKPKTKGKPVAVASAKATVKKTPAKKTKPAPKKKAKKTIEELDQEMADYFAGGEK